MRSTMEFGPGGLIRELQADGPFGVHIAEGWQGDGPNKSLIELGLRREIHADGSTKVFLNGQDLSTIAAFEFDADFVEKEGSRVRDEGGLFDDVTPEYFRKGSKSEFLQ